MGIGPNPQSPIKSLYHLFKLTIIKMIINTLFNNTLFNLIHNIFYEERLENYNSLTNNN